MCSIAPVDALRQPDLRTAARTLLGAAVDVAVATGQSPGRCTVVGEHVDYADGVVVCIAVDLHVAVAVRESPDGLWRVRSGTRRVERDHPDPCGDIGDRPFAVALALRERGLQVPPLDVAVAASLPESAGLSSSAAICTATALALLRRAGVRLTAAELIATTLHAERDIAGVPCGPLDQNAVTHAPGDGALVLDCRSGAHARVPWLQGYVLVASHTGDAHDVGGIEYAARRRQADTALRAIGAASWRDVGSLDGIALDALHQRRARHITTETTRAIACSDALRRGDAARVGALMHASHVSLRDDYEVSTPGLDAVCAAAAQVEGCAGARLVGAGFGGAAIALVREDRAAACAAAMHAAAPGGRGTWVLRPSPGVAHTDTDVVA